MHKLEPARVLLSHLSRKIGGEGGALGKLKVRVKVNYPTLAQKRG